MFSMKQITQEWIDKAEGDFATARRELSVQDNPNYDAVCFHTQQCIEKYLKACLQESEVEFDKTHSLTVLLDALLSIEPNWETMRPTLTSLTNYAVQYRYPGDSATKEEASKAFKDCVQILQVVKQHFTYGDSEEE